MIGVCPYCGSSDIWELHVKDIFYKIESWNADGTPNIYSDMDDLSDEYATEPPYICRDCEEMFYKPDLEEE